MAIKKTVAMLIAVMILFTAFASNGLEVYAALSRGDKNSEVKSMQQKLNALGYLKDTADGSYGPATEKAVKAFESAVGLSADGKADDKMLSRLSEVYNSTPTIKIKGGTIRVRKGAGTSYAKIGSVKTGATYRVLETKVVSGKTWYKFMYGTQAGWIDGSYTTLSYGDKTRTGTLTANDVNARTGPGTSYSKYKVFDKGYSFKILSEKAVDGTLWYSFIYSGRTLWISGKYVSLNGSSGGETGTSSTTATKATTTTKTTTSTTKNDTTTSQTKTGTVTGSPVNIRKGAGTNYAKVTSVNKGYTFTITGQKTVSGTVWYSFTRNGSTVWISGQFVKVSTTTNGTTTTKNDSGAQTVKTGTVKASPVNIRKGAGTNYAKVTSVNKGYTFTVTGQKTVNGVVWYSFTRNGSTVWICGTYVNVTTKTITTASTTTTTKPTSTTKSTTSSTASTTKSTTSSTTTTTTTTTTKSTTSTTESTTNPTSSTTSSTTASTTASTTKSTTSTTKTTAADDEEDDNLYGQVYDVNTSLNVRKSASSSASKLGTLKNKDYVVIVDYTSQSGWYKIIFGSGFGWVSSDYIKIVEKEDYVSDLAFSKDYFYVDQGKTKSIAIAGIKGVTYTSSDTAKLSINDSGVVTGIEPGMYTVTAKYGSNVATTEVVVLAKAKTLTEEQQNMGISEKGVAFIAEWEAGGSTNPDILDGAVIVFEPYKDASGYWTLGYGHAKTTTASKSWSRATAIKEFAKDIEAFFGDEIELSEKKPYLTEAEAQKLLMADLNQGTYVSAVRNWAVRNGVSLNQNQFDSLVSFTFNLGTSYWTSDTKRFYLKSAIIAHRSGDDADAEQVTEGFSRYIRSGSKYLKGLYYRRMNEAEMFTSADYGIEKASKFPVPGGINWS